MSGWERVYSFRSWLLERLLGTKWATLPARDDEIDALAERLGVQPELLLEARAEAKIQKSKNGLRIAAARPDESGRFKRYYQFHLFMPPPVHKAWLEECAYRELRGPVLLRALIQEYLMGDTEPTPLSFWYWKGKRYQMGKAEQRSPFLERATITQGANRALKRRAMAIGTTPTAIARALIIEALSGEHRAVKLIEHSMMFDDERRYLRRS